MPSPTRLSRLYDAAMDKRLLAATRARRECPDGRELRVETAVRGKTRVSLYPWDKMQLGDFFIVPTMGRPRTHFDVRFRQAANRRDWELTITPWGIGSNKTPGLRVALTCIGITELKRKAQHHHGIKGIRYSDGRWPAARAARFQRQQRLRDNPPPKLPDRVVLKDDPPLAVDAAIAVAETDPTADPGYNRAAILRERLAKLQGA